MISVPYNFVPLTPLIIKPDWAQRVSHDHPFKDGLSGELEVRIHTHTPLCVGGRMEAATDQAPGSVHFYRTPENELAIPGTSLKGMLRNVMKIACFGHFREVEDRRLGVRDLSKADNFYFRYMKVSEPRAGWLKFRNGRWYLTRCQFVRVHQRDIIDHFGIPQAQWTPLATAGERYHVLEKHGALTLDYDVKAHKAHPQGVAKNLREGNTGRLVVTGQPGSDFTGKKAKKWEFIFHGNADIPIELPQGVVDDFLFIHQESNEWAYWKNKGSLSDDSPGVPVFWRGNGMTVQAMGLAMLFRVAYKNSLHKAIQNTSPEHLDDNHPDMADLVFGHLDADEYGGLRGRVSVLGALADQSPETTWTRPTVLSAPKPTFYPAYIEQKDSSGYVTLMDDKPRLSGWKRYPVKDVLVQEPPEEAKTNNKVQVRLETVPAGTTFRTRIRFHNLRPVELGALLWVLDFGQNRHLRHALGMGKPYGLGQVSLEVDADTSAIRLNDPALEQGGKRVADWLQASRILFQDYMNQAWYTATAQNRVDWESSYPIRELLAMADPDEGRRHQDGLKYPNGPKPFADAKKSDKEWKRPAYRGARREPEPGALEPLAWEGDPGAAFARLDEVARKQAEKEEIRNAEGLQKYLLEIDLLLGQDELGKTDRKKLEKALKAAAKALEEDPANENNAESRFVGLLQKTSARYTGNDALGKLLKKLSKRFPG